MEFKADGAVLRLSETNGAVESLVAADGAERVMPAVEAFTLQLLDGKGEPALLKSSDFTFAREGGLLAWRHANGLVVHMDVSAENGEFHFTPSVEGIPTGMLLEWFDGPQVCISPDRALYWPYWDGCEGTNTRACPHEQILA